MPVFTQFGTGVPRHTYGRIYPQLNAGSIGAGLARTPSLRGQAAASSPLATNPRGSKKMMKQRDTTVIVFGS